MTLVKIWPQQQICNFLRRHLTDVNSSRSGQWIFPDFPLIESLNNSSFPRIGVTILSNPATPMAASEADQEYQVTCSIDIFSKKDQTYTITNTDDSLGTLSSTSNSVRMVYDYLPSNITSISHDATPFSTVTFVNSDQNFTSPASLSAGTVEVSRSTGNLNFSSADLASYDGEAITSTWEYVIEGEECAKYLATQTMKSLKNNWQTSTETKAVKDLRLDSSLPLPYEETRGLYRWNIQTSFRTYNIGEGL